MMAPTGFPQGNVLEVRDLTTHFGAGAHPVVAVDQVSFSMRHGETLAVVGESGSGKSMLAYSIMGLVQPPGRIVAGEVWMGEQNFLALDEPALRRVRGRDIGMIFQEPSTSLNPLMPVGQQVAEVILEHEEGVSQEQAMACVVERFRMVGIPAAEHRIHEYPHQLSGGMKQRVMIAMALACQPGLLIADEPTTALDVTIQAQVLRVLSDLSGTLGMALLLITHDLGVVADYADRIVVMYAGRKVEEGIAEDVLSRPAHPYTQALLACRPRIEDALSDRPLLEIAGTVPPLSDLPRGCAFAERCPHAAALCREAVPAVVAVPGVGDHLAACHFPLGSEGGCP
ncbi:ABC transporter ATP-binding protein [Castellaniella sp. GW247-6E4]|uniref:ABC transporter ATP-binding protein n=1 Tax=Castellaniella sp. GW247-6E4 TaxID=3140380 RepID=UPI003315C09F